MTGSDCPTGKEQFTRLGAQERRDALRARGDSGIKAYRCVLFCGAFHVGHTNRRRERLRTRTGVR